MHLSHYQVLNYKNIDDSTKIDTGSKVTCFVGKNEAGKTTLLQALYRLNPVEECTYDEVRDYPRKKLRAYQRNVKSGKEQVATVLKTVFTLDTSDIHAISEEHGSCVSKGAKLSVDIKYNGNRTIGLSVDEEEWLKNYIKDKRASEEESPTVKTTKDIESQIAALEALEDQTVVAGWIDELKNIQDKSLTIHIWNTILEDRIPKIFFFDDYRIMKGQASLDQITDSTDDGIKTLNELLALADITPQELQQNTNYEHHKANLEAIANEITDDVFKYWKQNSQLEVEFDVNRAPGNNQAEIFHVRIKNNKHRVTVPFDERSRGFVWFFSFLTAFKKLSQDHSNVIILLDEPGLNLHASAQADLLRFIEEVLATDHQIIYTTHSPFMIDSQHLERVRTVEDLEDVGVKVSSDCLSVDHNTVFPLQAAMGYSLAQTLFLGPNCLLVEGPSDLLYMQILSEVLRDKGREGLSDKWAITPVGGADKLATFATLIGSNELNICVLMDITKKDQQRVDNLIKNHFLTRKQIIELNQFTKQKDADIEDLFTPGEYIKLVKKTYPKLKQLTVTKLGQQPRIIKRIESFIKSEKIDTPFNHFKPSQTALSVIGKDIPVSEETLARFEAMFNKVNIMLP
ncbi:AAA family ATPase [Pseudodesulfovibrio senegalensis]|uniref:AAA family ATPase n=1 Tax=Pseudodesulfovibrio senegalensis TaxID=1721087 RepID=A0A6N6N3Q1_9BACT|nr:AAA family ATPase [Pseudodesulfovibrio senegalensis]KAB1441334.1 AAA family ATPase [Pseudodesulfovibrio senegalensis]